MPHVIVHFQGAETHRLEFDSPITIGRDLSCTIWVGDTKLSRTHCRIGPDDRGRWNVWDLDSRNGVYLNDLRVKRFVPRDGERFTVGRTTVEFHEGPLPLIRPATPLATHHQSLMTPLVGPVSDHTAPAHAATKVRVHGRILPTPRPQVTDHNEPLVRPFGLAFQRPMPRPILQAPVSSDEPTIDTSPAQSQSWLTSVMRRLSSKPERAA